MIVFVANKEYNRPMSLRKTSFVLDEFYHIYNRGNGKKIIFHDNQDYKRFLSLLYLSNTRISFRGNRISKNIFLPNKKNKIVHIGAYCLMANHFHLLITQTEDSGITKFMQKLTTAYSMYYNNKYKRTGSLFEGKFKSKYINNDLYFKYLFSYVHLNPLKLFQCDYKEKGVRNKDHALIFLEKYKYSSYLDFLGVKRDENLILDRQSFPNYFSTKEKFKLEIFEWLSYQEG